MKKILFLITILFISLLAIAQPPMFQWAKSIGGPTNDVSFAVEVDAAGNVYSTGYFTNTVDFDPGSGTFTLNAGSNEDIYVSKLSPAGNFIWAVKIGGPGIEESRDITVDKQGNVFLTGFFSHGTDFDPGAGTYTLATIGSSEAFVCKLTSSGSLVWVKQFTSTSWAEGHSIAVDPVGDIYTCGDFQGNADFDPGAPTLTLTSTGGPDAYISKLSSAGAFIWAKHFTGTDSESANSLGVDSNSDVYVTGAFTGTVDFNPGAPVFTVGTSQTNVEGYIVRFNSVGNFIWAETIGGSADDWGSAITLDKNDNVFITGKFQGLADLDPTNNTFSYQSAGMSDAFILKLQSSGAFLWARQIGGAFEDFGYSIDTDTLGNVYLGGYFTGLADFDMYAASYTMTGGASIDGFITKRTSTGNFSWAAQLGGGAQDIVSGVAVDSAMNVHSTGWFSGTCDFDPSQNTYSLTPVGQAESFVHKLSNCVIPATPVNVTPIWQLGVCDNATTTLIAAGSGTITWYSSLTGGSPIATGPYYTTPSLSIGSHTYYAEALTCTMSAVRSAFNVTVDPVVTASITRSVICKGESTQLQAGGSSNFNWDNGSTGTPVTVSPTVTTTYVATGINNSLFCPNSATVVLTVDPCTGLNGMNDNISAFEIFPNPAGNKVIVSSQIGGAGVVEIYDAKGALVLKFKVESTSAELNISVLAPGIYQVHCGSATKKLIIN